MNLTKIILRRPNPEPGQSVETVNYVVSGEPTPVDKLGADYRAFKLAHPERWARLPPALKTEALKLLQDGSSVEAVATACNIHVATVHAWMKRGPEAKKPGRKKIVLQENTAQEPIALPPVEGDATVTQPIVAVDRLASLADAYKAFKKDNPERWARLPATIKDLAITLLQEGTSADAIAAACGIHAGSVLAWARPRTQPVGRPKGSRRKTDQLGETAILLAPSDRPSWVRMRVKGTEVEVNEADFLRLFT